MTRCIEIVCAHAWCTCNHAEKEYYMTYNTTVLWFVLQVVRVFIIAASTTVYTYCQPYKSRLANLLETAVNLNFLFLLLVNTTSFFHDDLFTFSSLRESSAGTGDCAAGSLDGIAVVSWILMPLYYLPVLGACVTAAVLAILYLRYVYMYIILCSTHVEHQHVDLI